MAQTNYHLLCVLSVLQKLNYNRIQMTKLRNDATNVSFLACNLILEIITPIKKKVYNTVSLPQQIYKMIRF